MSQYSRSNKNQKPEDTTDSRPSRGEKVKQGLSVFQTVVATIASLLGIIVTSFTIMSLLNKDNQKTEDKPSSSTSVVVVHDKGSDSSATNTDANTNTQTDSSNTDASSQKETDSSSATETSSSAAQDQGSTATDSGAADFPFCCFFLQEQPSKQPRREKMSWNRKEYSFIDSSFF